MGALLDLRSEVRLPLAHPHKVGRAASCTLVLEGGTVSREHASIVWCDGEWEIRDLGSHNGTWVDGERLPAGTRAPLRQGALLGFGERTPSHRVEDLGAPEPLAVTRDGAWLEGRGGLLDLPGAEGDAVVLRDSTGRWVVEEGGSVRAVTHGEVLVVGEVGHRLLLPSEDPETRPRADLADAAAGARFRVSLDEEQVHLTIVEGPRAVDLGARTHHYLLLVLGRQRLDDEAAGVPPDERGWIDAETLGRQLRHDNRQINLLVHRARRQAADAGLRCAHLLVERRELARQLRLGVAHVEVGR